MQPEVLLSEPVFYPPGWAVKGATAYGSDQETLTGVGGGGPLSSGDHGRDDLPGNA